MKQQADTGLVADLKDIMGEDFAGLGDENKETQNKAVTDDSKVWLWGMQEKKRKSVFPEGLFFALHYARPLVSVI